MTTDAKSKALIEGAAELVGLLRRNAARTEEDRRVAEENIEVLADTGLFVITVPERLGGHQASVRTLLEVTAELGRGCGSTAWTTALINVCGWMIGLYPERAQREVYGEDPGARACSVLTPGGTSRAAASGQVITGRWPFASGCLHARWALLGTPVTGADGEQTDRGVALVPMDELTVEDTWHTAGMRGTGSHTLLAEDVFVPAHRILSVTGALRGEYATEFTDETLYRAAFVPLLSSVLVGPQLGLARGGLELVMASLAQGRPMSHTFYEQAREASSTQMQVAEAAQLIDTAALHLMRAADDIDGWAASGRNMPLRDRARVRMDTATVARRSREALDILLNVHGAGSFAEANPLQRIWRDQETASRHAMTNPAVASELYGRALLDIQEQISPLI
ncbi:acyl-CoA dehydrogenase family protein [Streptomyces sp. LX-29]|uniref:acyl-CoA dehydrogenase family protein n=1 Tax=Streptomyces sp. LX-29 TaxID=2900152 RepID=UPI00240E2FBC|nr:acyl-CoA dehydrogenase family protein [Streptomyces sp. LX-29]WFB05693.1 acyl-CoA dehydrogenase family protein [Streptomyces sp. LX-29]